MYYSFFNSVTALFGMNEESQEPMGNLAHCYLGKGS
jgi:hypothetical protein